jgi:enoyl-CoA hydratase
MNALSPDLMTELSEVLTQSEDNPDVAVVVLTGSEKAFAAGADIKAMKDMNYLQMYQGDFITKNWERITTFRKPTIAAVAGFALGGGCRRQRRRRLIASRDLSWSKIRQEVC